jgi:hypothetical protein
VRWLASAFLVVLASVWSPPAAAETRENADDKYRWLVPTVHSAGLVFTMRYVCSLRWPETYNIQRAGRNWNTFKTSWSESPTFDTGEAFFEWDYDPWTINLVGHGLMGSEFYLRHRQARHPWWLALAMTTAWTVVWEYLVEGWHKHPSGIDLAWSPVGGGLIGEGRYRLVRLIQRLRPSVGRRILLYVVDPFGQLERDLFDLSF